MTNIEKVYMNALDYAKRGLFVFPVNDDRRPFKGFPWREWSCNDPGRVADAMNGKYAKANWAVDCGKSGICVIDVDPRHNGNETLAKLPEKVESDFTVRTPRGGVHYYFKGLRKSLNNGLGEGIDIKSDGGYVVIPGSVAFDKPYIAESEGDIPELPQWLAKYVPEKHLKDTSPKEALSDADLSHNIEAAVQYLKNEAPACDEGSRNSTLVIVSRFTRDLGISLDTALGLIDEHWNQEKVTPPIGHKEFLTTVKSAYRNCENAFGSNTPDALFKNPMESIDDECPAPEEKLPDDPLGALLEGEIEVADEDPPLEIKKPSKPDLFQKVEACDIAEEDISKRDYVMAGRYLTNFVTITSAEGGSSKSTLTMIEAACITSGKDLLGPMFHVKKRGPVAIFNFEDPMDELQRRIIAIKKTYELSPNDLRSLFLLSEYGKEFKLIKTDPKTKIDVINYDLVKQIIEFGRREKVVMMSFDPMVACHGSSENDNNSMELLMRIFVTIAERVGCAVSVVHHNRKPASGASGSMHEARGASAISGAARIMHHIGVMKQEEATKFRVSEKDRTNYVYIALSKGNFEEPGRKAMWMERISKDLINGDSVGCLVQSDIADRIVDESEMSAIDLEEALMIFNGAEKVTKAQLIEAIRAKRGIGRDPARGVIDRAVMFIQEGQRIGAGQWTYQTSKSGNTYHFHLLEPGQTDLF